MIKGLYSAASGMFAIEQRQDILANNIANSGSPGFKRHSPVQLGFYDTFHNTLHRESFFQSYPAPGGGVKGVESFPDFRPGVMAQTGNPLNVAIDGPGFFAVQTPNGERFTRSGDFMVDADGDLAAPSGAKVLGTTGDPIPVGGGPVNIAEDGTVVAGGLAAGRLRMVQFESPERLERTGENLYFANEGAMETSIDDVESRLNQGQLEQSNVDVSREMMSLMTGMRAYEANQRVIQTLDGTLGRLIEQVAMPQ